MFPLNIQYTHIHIKKLRMVLASHVSRSASESSALSSNLHYSMEVLPGLEQLLQTDDQDFIMALLDRQKHVWEDQELLEVVENYSDNGRNITGFSASLNQYLHHVRCIYQSRIHAALRICEQEAEAEVSFHGLRNPSPLTSNKFFHDLAAVYGQQLLTRETLQSFENNLDDKLDCLSTGKIGAAVFFTVAAAMSAVVAAVTANAKGLRATAAMAAGPVFFGAICTWVLALIKKQKNAVTKQKKIIISMIVAADVTISDLSKLYVLARRLHFQTESLSEMVDEGATEAAVRNELVEFTESLQELQFQANYYCRNVLRGRAAVLQSITKYLE